MKQEVKQSIYKVNLSLKEVETLLKNLPYELEEHTSKIDSIILKYHVYFDWRRWHYYLKIKIVPDQSHTTVITTFYEDSNNLDLSLVNHYFSDEKDFFECVKRTLKSHLV